jgi:hypothetical protein
MNDNIGRICSPRRPWPLRARAMVAVTTIGGIALLATACGGGSSPSTAGGSTQHDRALAYSQCMRSHGIANFPDPNSNGDLLVQGHDSSGQSQGGSGQRPGGSGQSQNSVDMNSPQYAAANRACEKLLSGGGQMSGTQQQQALGQLVQYAQCMRTHGVPNFPDPIANNGGMGFNSSGINLNSPQFQSAQHACQSLQSKAKGQSPAASRS